MIAQEVVVKEFKRDAILSVFKVTGKIQAKLNVGQINLHDTKEKAI